eukprot:TRINITY_DN3159_c0_g1_i1.p1 TRINITY_DN3159_c0_g1~~TRINITY_DN3159_c0_g1_i1.p1  ORF type:complete len:272 (-),score=49.93 TRINITY_DN3159_c0_g1_i1:58-807(-)
MSAQTYTTRRGKTKKAKEGIRKDARNNAANKLMATILQPTKAFEVKERPWLNPTDQPEKIGYKPSARALKFGANAEESEAPIEKNSLVSLLENLDKPTFKRCFYLGCTGSTTPDKRCGQCLIARYCSADCQKMDWKKQHKQVCKQAEATLSLGCGVAIKRSVSLSFSPSLAADVSKLYNAEECKAPCDEFHGVVATPADESAVGLIDKSGKCRVQLADQNLKTTDIFLLVSPSDLCITNWPFQSKTVTN